MSQEETGETTYLIRRAFRTINEYLPLVHVSL